MKRFGGLDKVASEFRESPFDPAPPRRPREPEDGEKPTSVGKVIDYLKEKGYGKE